MKNIGLIVLTLLLSFSCQTETKKTNKPSKNKVKPVIPTIAADSNEVSKANLINFEKGKVIQLKKLPSGINLKWFAKASIKKACLQKGEMVLLDYRLGTPDGKIIDGNNRLGVPFIPFMVGYNMQTIGWDLALLNLRVGDFCKVEVPASLAYGSKGLKGAIEANTPIWLYIKVISKLKPSSNSDGVKIWDLRGGIDGPYDKSQQKEVEYNAIVSSESSSNVMNTYMNKFSLKYSPGQTNVVPGIRGVLNNAKKDQRFLVLVSAEQAYGQRGYADLVKPNEALFYNIHIENVRSLK